jgi:opacity protein-like surface antigen
MFKPKKLRRTLLLLSLSSTLTLPAYAFLNPSANFNGFYAGISGGGLTTEGQLSANQSITFFRPTSIPQRTPTRILSVTHAADLRDDSWIGDIHLGYGHALGPVYIGADVFANWANRDLQTSYINSMNEFVAPGFNDSFSVTANQNIKAYLNDVEYGVDLRPGIFLTSTTLLFGDIGAAFNSIHLNSNSLVTINNLRINTTATTPLASNVKKNITSLRLGGGIEERIGAHWGVSADYIYTDYGNINVSGITNTNNNTTPLTPSTPNGFTAQAQTKDIISQAAMLGVNYYFDPAAEGTGAFFGMDPCVSTVFNGFYASIEGGVLQDRAEINSGTSAQFIFSKSTPPNIETMTDSQSPHVAKDTGVGSIDVGYGHLLGVSPLYLGVDMFANLGNQDLLVKYSVNDTTLNAPSSLGEVKFITGSAQVVLNSVEWGGDLRPGILLGPKTLLSGIVGFAVNQLKLSANNTFQFTDNSVSPPQVFTSSLAASGSKNVTALRLGGGLQEYLGQHLSVNVDYIYTDYGSINVGGATNISAKAGSNPPIVTPNGFTNQTKANVSSQALMAGLTYHFGGTATA